MPPSGSSLHAPEDRDAATGVALMMASVFLFAIMDATVKWLGDSYPTSHIVLFRCAVALPVVFVFVLRAGGLHTLRTRRPGVHFLRSLVGLSAMAAAFWAFSQMRLADAIAIMFAAPIFMTALSVPLLKERVGPRRWTAVGLGFIGVLVIVDPGGGVFSAGAWAALAAAVLMAFAMILIRKLSASEPASSITFYFTLTGSLFGLAWTLVEGWQAPVGADLALMVCVGLLGAVAQYAMTLAFRHADVAQVAPLEYGALLWSALIGYILWSEVPDARTWIGAAIIIGSGLFMLYRERKLAQAAGTTDGGQTPAATAARAPRPRRLPRLRGRA
ncbi:DMT family transporter [Marivibrio halodurans]|uniref:DMT family transporter n=1 Tax=Marivibrio halodurans TaxID=2039722 RepID=A0A8J7V3S5_9PROT|nr:DMT family transporter [Marivibrio halodurans]MBP5858297.1 DMT family transporter [Marivibrio halodurans]